MLISVHIPKVAGTSFRSLLEQSFQDKLYLDYTDKPLQKNKLARILQIIKSNYSSSPLLLQQYHCIHGHFMPAKYYFLKQKSFATWFRDPVERVISNYYHWQRNEFKHPKIKNKNCSLEEYSEIEHFQNLYATYLWGMNLQQFDFIGITENYQNSLTIFEKIYAIHFPSSLENLNTNPLKKSASYTIDTDLYNHIAELNKKDVIIYDNAVKMNKALEQKYILI